MKNIWKNYKTTIVLIFSLIIGAIAGLIFGEKTLIVKPIGTLFMNLLLVIIVPLIFLTISTSIAKIKQPKRLGKVITTIFGVFIIIVSAIKNKKGNSQRKAITLLFFAILCRFYKFYRLKDLGLDQGPNTFVPFTTL